MRAIGIVLVVLGALGVVFSVVTFSVASVGIGLACLCAALSGVGFLVADRRTKVDRDPRAS